MNKRRKFFAVVLALLIFVTAAITVAATERDDAADYVRQILNYYRYYQDAADTDIACLSYALAEIDLPLAQAWTSITEYWSYVNSDMTIYPDVLPDGLPQDDSLCIVVMGYALNNNGSMKPELIGRLETALRSAEKYPNAYIACTGGGTAKNNRAATEAGQMAQWLLDQGIAAERLIIESKSYSTSDNARYTCEILANLYPQVTHLAIVTSDYHLPHSCLVFHTKATLATYENNAPALCVAANAAYQTDRTKESFALQLSSVSQISNVSVSGMKQPKLSTPECILVSGSSQCISGSELNLQVIAYYNTGLYRDVTDRVKYSGIDLASVGMQDVTITYEEKGVTVSSTVTIEMLAPETEAPTQIPTVPATEAPTEPPATEPAPLPEKQKPVINWLPIVVGLVIVLIVAEIWVFLRLRRIRKLQKAAIAAAEAEKLPDDDSPLEYI